MRRGQLSEQLEPRLVLNADLNDQISEAIQLSSTASQYSESINPGTDVEMFRFSVQAGQRLSFDIDRPAGGRLDSYLRLFNAQGNQLAYNDDAAAPGEARTVESYLEYTFGGGGTYYLGVSGYGNSGYSATAGTNDRSGSTGDYTLVLSEIDGDDQIAEAVSLGNSDNTLTRTGAVDTARDVDMYSFTVSSTRQVMIDVDRPAGSTLDSYLRLFRSNGTLVVANDDGPTPGESASVESYVASVLEPGTYFVGVSGFGNAAYDAVSGTGDSNGSTGGYSISITAEVDLDDAINQANNLGTLAGTVQRTGYSIENARDVDLFRFDVTAGQRVTFNINRPSGLLDSYLRLFNQQGTQLAANDDGPTPGETASVESFLDYVFSSAGTYFVGVSGYGNSTYNAVTGDGDANGSTGAYTLVLTSDSDADDAISQATVLGTLTGPVERRDLAIDNARDVDLFQFDVSAGQRVTFNINRPSGSLDSYLRLFDRQGVQLAANDDGPAPGEAGSLESYLDFTFSTAGRYFVGVSGFGNNSYSAVTGDGDTNGSTGAYSLVVTPVVIAPPPPDGSKVLYLNFDGANLSRSELTRWAGNDWSWSVNMFDGEGDGVSVQPFLSGRGDREQVITQLMSHVAGDLSPFGIEVRRITGDAIEGVGATTIFLGRSTLTSGCHIACDIDFGNNNLTDIAFVGDENWGSAADTALALADVTLHEAGHTFGLYHVNSGNESESMGLRYSTSQDQWLRNTAFLNQAFPEFSNHGGGRGPQNSFQTMANTFSGTGAPTTGSPFSLANLTREQLINILSHCDDHLHEDEHEDDHDHELALGETSVGNREEIAAGRRIELVPMISSAPEVVTDEVSVASVSAVAASTTELSEAPAPELEAVVWENLMSALHLRLQS